MRKSAFGSALYRLCARHKPLAYLASCASTITRHIAVPSVIPAVKKANPVRDIDIKFVMKFYPCGVGLRKVHVALKCWVDGWVKTNLKNGKFNEICKRHFGMSLPEEMLM